MSQFYADGYLHIKGYTQSTENPTDPWFTDVRRRLKMVFPTHTIQKWVVIDRDTEMEPQRIYAQSSVFAAAATDQIPLIMLIALREGSIDVWPGSHRNVGVAKMLCLHPGDAVLMRGDFLHAENQCYVVRIYMDYPLA